MMLLLLIVTACSVFILSKWSQLTIEAAMNAANIEFDQIIYETMYKDSIVIFYTNKDNLSAGRLTKNVFGYQWTGGSGSDDFAQDAAITWSISNFTPKEPYDEEDIITIAKGVIHDEKISELTIHFKDAEDVKATVIEIDRGRVWYAFSDSPVNSSPDVTIQYKDGTMKGVSEKYFWDTPFAPRMVRIYSDHRRSTALSG